MLHFRKVSQLSDSKELSFLGRAFSLVILFLVVLPSQLFATHLRAGQIRVVYVSERTVRIIIEVWTNDFNTPVLFGGEQDILDFGDGSTALVPETPNMARRDGGPPLPEHVKYAKFEILHTYEAPGIYTVSYREPNRNQGVLNMNNSVQTYFYLETRFILDPLVGENESPELAVDPIDRACPGVAFFHNPGAHDPDGTDRLRYKMVIPFSNRSTNVVNYRDPNAHEFYVDPPHGNEAKNDFPEFNINEITGTITWDAPGKVGEYNIAFHIIEERKIEGEWMEIGYVRRDMQILVEDCDNERPTLELPPDTCVIAGTLLEVPIVGKDPDGDQVKIEAFSPIFNFPFDLQSPFNPPATITPNPKNEDVFVDVPATTIFKWQTECAYVKAQPYNVVFKITDNPGTPGVRLATFETWSITVVGPKPLWNSAVKDEGNRSVTLNWQPYECTNAVAMQIWRKVDGSDFQPETCDTGMPAYLGYELIKTVSLAEVASFVDSNNGRGLDVGPKFCYRLVAVFPPDTQAESLVSDDICVDPFKLVDPVITNVDVDFTSDENGRIIVKWIPPQENDNFPKDYNFTYKVFRGVGFSGDSTLLTTTSANEYIDEQGLDTRDNVYNYTIHAYSTDGSILVGTSSQASSVRAEASSQLREIELTWSADVPWTNSVAGAGYFHKIYRGSEGADSKDDLTLIDEVDVTTTGFVYEDRGQWDGNPLEQKLYCYMVETYGSYGNEDIHNAPLINRSQIICAEPGDNVPPCKPDLALEGYDCSKVASNFENCSGTNIYRNVLTWERDPSDCGRDISHYIVFYSNRLNGDFDTLAVLPPGVNTYTDELRNSYARCYKIAAVDRSGNSSELSEMFCFDNCPYYELPNVFTPNRDGCNDKFRAYNHLYENSGEVENAFCTDGDIPDEHKRRCARFVEKVVFHVYNRWGREVYNYTGEIGSSADSPKDAILINWDGKSNEGQELSTGIYYYVAEVTFISIRPENRHKTIKGWVHLIRDAD